MSRSVMPLLAQSFVETHSGVTFEMVGNTSGQLESSARTPPSTSRKSRRVRSPQPATDSHDIFSWTDAELASAYRFIREIAYGNWGSVWLCEPKSETAKTAHVAVKLVHRSKNPTSAARVRALWSEMKVVRGMRKRKHPNVIAFDSFIITSSYALIVMEYHPKLMPVALSESKARLYFRQLVSAVDYLHANGYTHNDIKPHNVLLSADDCPILADFGFANHHPQDARDRFLSWTSWGTPEYLAPERSRGVHHDERLSDIWALGVTMYEVVVGRTPFEKDESEEFLNREALEVYYSRTVTGHFFGDVSISSEFASLVREMVDPDVSTRLRPCGSALQHVFFNPTFPPLPILPSPTSIKSVPVRLDSLPATPQHEDRKLGKARTEPKKPKATTTAAPSQPKPFKIFADENQPLTSTPPAKAERGSVLGDSTNRPTPLKLRPVEAVEQPKIVSIRTPQSRIPLRKEKRPVTTPAPLRNVLSPKVPKAVAITDNLASAVKQQSSIAANVLASNVSKSHSTGRESQDAYVQESPKAVETVKKEDYSSGQTLGTSSIRPASREMAHKAAHEMQEKEAQSVMPKAHPSLAPTFIGKSPPQSDFAIQKKRGHRRIPTAIRNVPSIMLTESADEETWDWSDTSMCSTPASDRPSSPPAIEPRLVEEGRQLPTWIPEEDSDRSDEDGDVDEPTVTITTPVKRSPGKRSTLSQSRSRMARLSATSLSRMHARSPTDEQHAATWHYGVPTKQFAMDGDGNESSASSAPRSFKAPFIKHRRSFAKLLSRTTSSIGNRSATPTSTAVSESVIGGRSTTSFSTSDLAIRDGSKRHDDTFTGILKIRRVLSKLFA